MATWTNATQNSASFTNATPSLVSTLATAGLYYGFGCFTYSGTEVLSTALPVFTNETIN